MSEQNFYLYIDGKPVKVSEEVYREFMHYERKERYFMEDLKAERMVIDPEAQTVKVIPSREDSYERLLETHRQFTDPGGTAEDAAVKNILMEQLAKALHTLSDDELRLIEEFFYLERTEREISSILNIARTTLQRRRSQVLDKLRCLLEKTL